MNTQFNDYSDQTARDRLKALHEKKTSEPEVVSTIIAETIRRKITSYDRILNGEVNEVYTITLEDNTKVILRIGHIPGRSFEAETWAIERAKDAGVPVANILAIGTLNGADKPSHYSIQEMLKGKRFDSMLWEDRIAPERAQAITQQAGEILARLHSITATTGYGNIDERGKGKYPNVMAWIQAHLDKQGIYEELFTQQNLPSSMLEAVFAKLQEAETLFDPAPHLLHMDYGPKHIFVGEDDKVTGIIDFEGAEGGDIALDFASWEYWFSKSVPTEWLYEGYKKISKLGDNFNERLRIAQLHELLDLLNYYTNVGPAPEAAAAGAVAIKKLITP